MSSKAETSYTRGKANKGGKVVSLSIIWVGLAIALVAGVLTVVSTYTGSNEKFDRDIVAVTGVTQGDKLQPVSTKIVASDNANMITAASVSTDEDYADVWSKLERLAPPTATDAEREAVIVGFLSGLNYQMTKRGGEIVSITNGDQISPTTLTCYLNGYIPDKPYLKTNCPSY